MIDKVGTVVYTMPTLNNNGANKMARKDWVSKIHAHAMANYENGWDFIVECYPEEDVLELLDDDTTTYKAAIKELQSIVDLHEEQAANCGAYDEY